MRTEFLSSSMMLNVGCCHRLLRNVKRCWIFSLHFLFFFCDLYRLRITALGSRHAMCTLTAHSSLCGRFVSRRTLKGTSAVSMLNCKANMFTFLCLLFTQGFLSPNALGDICTFTSALTVDAYPSGTLTRFPDTDRKTFQFFHNCQLTERAEKRFSDKSHLLGKKKKIKRTCITILAVIKDGQEENKRKSTTRETWLILYVLLCCWCHRVTPAPCYIEELFFPNASRTVTSQKKNPKQIIKINKS